MTQPGGLFFRHVIFFALKRIRCRSGEKIVSVQHRIFGSYVKGRFSSSLTACCRRPWRQTPLPQEPRPCARTVLHSYKITKTAEPETIPGQQFGYLFTTEFLDLVGQQTALFECQIQLDIRRCALPFDRVDEFPLQLFGQMIQFALGPAGPAGRTET